MSCMQERSQLRPCMTPDLLCRFTDFVEAKGIHKFVARGRELIVFSPRVPWIAFRNYAVVKVLPLVAPPSNARAWAARAGKCRKANGVDKNWKPRLRKKTTVGCFMTKQKRTNMLTFRAGCILTFCTKRAQFTHAALSAFGLA